MRSTASTLTRGSTKFGSGIKATKWATLAFLVASSSMSFIDTVSHYADVLPPEGLSQDGIDGFGANAMTIAGGTVIGTALYSSLVHTDLTTQNRVCGSSFTNDFYQTLRTNVSPNAAEAFKYTQMIAGIPGALLGGLISSLGTAIGEVATDGQLKSSTNCPQRIPAP